MGWVWVCVVGFVVIDIRSLTRLVGCGVDVPFVLVWPCTLRVAVVDCWVCCYCVDVAGFGWWS